MIGRLAWVGLAVSDVERTAEALASDFGLARIDRSVGDGSRTAPSFTVGESSLVLFAPDDPFLGGATKPGVHHIALAVDDLDAAGHACAQAGVQLADGAPSAGLAGRRRRLLARDATAGVVTWLTEPLDVRPPRAGWVERIDHVGVASGDNLRAIESFVQRLGCPLESTQTDLEVRIPVESFTSDKYGAAYHTRAPEPVGGLRVAFITVGDCELEFLQDFDPRHGAALSHGQPGTTKQDQSAIAKFIDSRGAGLHHLSLKVTDIDAALASLARAGHAVIDRVGRPGSRRARIGFLHPKTLGGVLVHLVERDAH
jgi:catechol 2,3-dioxygenase-like lactoylglutathione lyase family enzyme